MKVLFLHQNMPGQYKHLCRAFGADPKNTVVFITKPKKGLEIPGVHKVEFQIPREPSTYTHRYLTGFERTIIEGQEIWRMCNKLKHEEGFIPDVIVAHPGWGDTLFIKDVYPDTPLLSFFEFYYRTRGADVNFDIKDHTKPDDDARIRMKNANNLFALECTDWGITPTRWQYVQHPKDFLHKISVIHDGVDTDLLVPQPDAEFELPNGKKLTKQDEVITYVSRNFEPYRGFPTFMRAAKEILARRPDCHIIAVGGDSVSYGKKPSGTNKTWRQVMSEEVKIPPELAKRIHWYGFLNYDDYLKVIRISSAHIYLTYPFVLSWSMIESMSSGCLVIGSDTPPVVEVIKDGYNGLLTDFFDHEMLAKRIDEVFEHEDRMQQIRENARKTALERYSLKKLMPLHISLVEDVARKEFPPRTAELIKKMNIEFGLLDPKDLSKIPTPMAA